MQTRKVVFRNGKLAKKREKRRKGLGNARVFKINPLMTLYYQINNYQLITEEYRYRNSSKSWRNTGGLFPGKRTAVNPQLNLSELVNCHVTFYRRLVMFWNRVPCRNDQVPVLGEKSNARTLGGNRSVITPARVALIFSL